MWSTHSKNLADSLLHIALSSMMPKLFFQIRIWFAVFAASGLIEFAAAQGKSEAQKWLDEAEKAWVEATELDEELKAKAAEEEEEEDDDDEKKDDDEEVVKPDFAGAFELFKKAGEAKHAKAALRVSELLLEGYGIPKSTAGAFEWALKAAEMGDLEAQLLTASKYEEGRGATKSLSKALVLYEKALEQGSSLARMKVAGLFDRGEPGVEKNQAKALPLFQQAAKGGSPEAIYMVGLYLQRGFVVEKDDDAASQWFLRAAEIGEPQAQRKLAMRYFLGTGVQQDTVEALKWCELTLKNPNGDVETKNLAREYKESIAETVTPRKAAQAMKQAERLKLKTFEDISLPPMPYNGPVPVYHTLTDTTGNKLEAAVIAVKADSVLLERRDDGKKFSVPLNRLSDESKKLLEGLK